MCTHPAEPLQGHLTASRYPPTTEAWAAPASPTLFRSQTHIHILSACATLRSKHSCVRDHLCVADLVEAAQTPGRRRCSRCSSSVCGAHTLSLNGSPAPRRLSLAASGAAVDTGHSSGAVWTGGGWRTRSPERQEMRHIFSQVYKNVDATCF